MDKEGLAQYRARKKQDSKVDEITSDINSLKSELSEIKEALKILIEKNQDKINGDFNHQSR